jgi:hypothetical protein
LRYEPDLGTLFKPGSHPHTLCIRQSGLDCYGCPSYQFLPCGKHCPMDANWNYG